MAELTNLAAYLISDTAGYINGEVVTIDGGEWIGGAGEFNKLSTLTSEEWDEIATLTRGKKEGGEAAYATADHREAVDAFLHKRAVKFTGK